MTGGGVKYIYIYKTPEGVRTEGRYEASSRDEVFAALRKQGIRPIKVVSADGAKANGEIHGVRKRFVTLFILLAVLVTSSVAAWIVARVPRDPSLRPEVVKLVADMDAALRELEESVRRLGIPERDDYRAIFEGADVKATVEALRRAGRLTEAAKTSLQKAFEICENSLASADAAARQHAEALVKARTADVEDMRTAFSNRGFALVLLSDNRGRWRIVEGRVAFDEDYLARIFEYCCGRFK